MKALLLISLVVVINGCVVEPASPDVSAGKVIYLALDGDDSWEGTRSKPYRTLERAVANVAPGDTVYLRGGVYSLPMVVHGLRGRSDAPITISAAPGERVVFDGTDALPDAWQVVTPDSEAGQRIQGAQWQRTGGNKLYSLKLEDAVHALIYDGRLMSEARWPNARWDDPWRLDRYNVLRRATEQSTPGELFDGFPTENTLEESSKWVHYDREARAPYRETLAETGLDFTGAVVVISYAWGSFATQVTNHDAGADSIRFDTTFAGSGSIQEEAVRFVINRIQWDNPNRFMRSSHGGIHFFFEGLPALDIAEEWWYDADNKTLFFIAPDGKTPDAAKVRGKRRDYLITIRDSSHVHLKGIEFNGAAALLEGSEYSRIEDSNFRFSAANKFTIGNFDMPVTTRITNRGAGDGKDRSYGNALINCQFTYLDGNAFEGRSTGLSIDNVLIYRTQQTTLGLDSRSMSVDRPSLIRRVTLADVGASVGIKGGGIDSVYELNNISSFGGLQYDGAALQMGGRDHIIYRYNWSHDHPKRSFRFDAGNYPAYSNAFGEMSYNVAWNTPGGFAIKGDDHLIHNNLLLGDSKFELFNMARWASENRRTVVANNIVETMSAGVNDRNPAMRGEPADVIAIRKNNYRDDPASELRDPGNLDFRPRAKSALVDGGHRIERDEVPWKQVDITGIDDIVSDEVDIGPYEYGSPVYWIPGFQFPHASTPVPPTGSTTVKPDVDLMWLDGYQANEHHVYFGDSEEAVANATLDSPEFRQAFRSPENIFDPGELQSGKRYYWRVDALRNDVANEGEVWSFTVGDRSPPVDVIILAGQSNMVGSARVSNAPQGLFPLPQSIELHDFSRTSKFLPVSGRFGPEASFAAALAEANPERRYVFIKWAVGGTSQADWSPDWSAESVGAERAETIGSLYRKSLADIRNVLEGRNARVAGLLWMQGEADSRRQETADAYTSNMARLIASLRRDLDAPGMRVIMGLVNPDTPRHAFVQTVQERMKALAADDPLVAVIPTDGLQKMDDRVHYDHVGQAGLGGRFAASWLAKP